MPDYGRRSPAQTQWGRLICYTYADSPYSDILRHDLCGAAGNFPHAYAFDLAAKQQASRGAFVAHPDGVAVANLVARHQVRQRLHEKTLDGALQVPGAITGI